MRKIDIAAYLVVMLAAGLLLYDGSRFGLYASLVVMSLITMGAIFHGWRIRRMQKANYAWYRATYPQAYRNGRVICRHCGNDRIYVKNVMKRTFMREHFCAECGTTMYYSPEGMRL